LTYNVINRETETVTREKYGRWYEHIHKQGHKLSQFKDKKVLITMYKTQNEW